MALSQLTPEQFDTGMQRFQKIQGMQPQRLSALQARQSGLTGRMAEQGILQGPETATPQNPAYQARQSGLTANMAGGQMMGQVYLGEVRDSSGNVVRPALPPRDMNPISDVFPAQYSQPAMPPFIEMNPVSDVFPAQYPQPTMSPFSNTQGSFGTGAMPYTQPYYQRSFNPYAGGYGMGFGGGMPSYGGFGGGMPSYGGFGGGQQMYGGFGGGKGGGRPSYGGGKGGRGY